MCEFLCTFAAQNQINNCMKKLLTLILAFLASYSISFAEIYSGTCGAEGDGSNLQWEVNSESFTLTITGSGAMKNYDPYSAPWKSYYFSIVSLPDGLTTIGSHAFHENSITSIEIPNSVTEIRNGAFLNCYYIATVAMPSNLNHIGDNAFYGCKKLVSIDIPAGVTSIPTYAFDDCTNMIAINAVADHPVFSTIDGILFDKNAQTVVKCPCGKQGDYTVPASVTEIAQSAFYDCQKLSTVFIPSTVTTIGTNAFKNVLNIEYHGSATDAPWGAISMNGYVKDQIVYNSAAMDSIRICSKSISGNIVIPNSVVCIQAKAFMDCTGIKSVVIPNSVTSIEEYAFNYCMFMESISLPNSITVLNRYTLNGCYSLHSITIPASITEIGREALDCRELQEVKCLALTPPAMSEEGVFGDLNRSLIPLYVPEQSIDLYTTADQWKDFNPILPIGASERVNNILPASSTTKTLHNGQILIHAGEKTYTVTGQEVR